MNILDPNNTRLRERNGDILIKCYKDMTMKHQGCVERKKIVLELFKEPLSNQHNLIYFTKLDVKKFRFEPVKEIKIKKRLNLKELAEILVQSGLEIPVDQIEATKIRDVRDFRIEDILDHRFFDLNTSTKILSVAPFYLEGDGNLFILKDKRETLSGHISGFKKHPNKKFFESHKEKELKIFVKPV